MFRQFFAGMEWSFLPLFAMGVFLTVFTLVVVRVFVLQKRSEFDALAALPLDDGTQVNLPMNNIQLNASEVKS
jgi:cytochrome c oxidase cbb3-type subunit 4